MVVVKVPARQVMASSTSMHLVLGGHRIKPVLEIPLALISSFSFLSAMPRYQRCEWTFPNPNTGKPYVSIFWAWDTARNRAELADVRIHDLRHSTASFLVNAGRTLYEVQHILGHTQVKTTQRYAHLSHDTLLAATNSINTALGGMFMPMIMANKAHSQPA